MIEAGEKAGLIKEGTVIIEPTSGNTGVQVVAVEPEASPVLSGERYLSTGLFQ